MDFSNRPANRTWLCSVVFMDIVAYTRHPLTQQIAMKNRFNEHVTSIANKHFSETDLIVVDSGDGGALCYLGDPEDMLFCARDLMEAFADKGNKKGSEKTDTKGHESSEESSNIDLPVRIGINLGPVKIHTSVAGQPNPIGDGINVAQRVMSFAEAGQIMISRSFYEVVGCLSEENSYMFEHVGIRSDKHIRKHDLYRIRTSKEVADVISSSSSDSHDIYDANEHSTVENNANNITIAKSLEVIEANKIQGRPLPPPLQVETSQRQESLETKEIQKDIEAALIHHIGPIAKILVRTEFKANHSSEQITQNLSSHISDDGEKGRFQDILQRLFKKLPNYGNNSRSTNTNSDNEQTENNSKNWNQSELDIATNHLVQFLGPVAKILVKKAAKISPDIATLYQVLAKRIHNKDQRKQFLDQIGMQENKSESQ